MSYRAEHSRTGRSGRLLAGVTDDARDSLDAATPEALLAIVGADGCHEIIQTIAERAVQALDSADLALVLWQTPRFLELEASMGCSVQERRRAAKLAIGDSVRGVAEDYVRFELRRHLEQRAAQFRAARPGDETSEGEAAA